jgi:hypothetical protein
MQDTPCRPQTGKRQLWLERKGACTKSYFNDPSNIAAIAAEKEKRQHQLSQTTNPAKGEVRGSFSDPSKLTPFAAVEARAQLHSIPIIETLESITNRLKASCDEDITILSDKVSIDIRDPFMQKIFDTPVRGSECQHYECFDLKAFLESSSNTLGSKIALIGPKCPHCQEVTPLSSLRVDEFFVSVREKLAADNKLGVKGILVAKDGSWSPEHTSESDHNVVDLCIERSKGY